MARPQDLRPTEMDSPHMPQAMRAVFMLRHMIANGQLSLDERFTEVQLAELLSMSRTPIRSALQTLKNEGLIVSAVGGGYRVRRFLPDEIAMAIDIRGMFEGACVRLIAEQGLPPLARDALHETCAKIGDALSAPTFDPNVIALYGTLNAKFHSQLSDACQSPLLQFEIVRANARPFGSASALIGLHRGGESVMRHLWVGHDQHVALLEALDARQGARAEHLMREHARLSHRNLQRAIAEPQSLTGLEGAGLIQRSI